MSGFPLRPINMDYSGIDPKFRNTISDTPPQMRKIFIGGLPFNCTREIIFHYFAQFGIIQDAVLMVDAETKVSRGFGFVTFHAEESVHAVMLSRPHMLLNKMVDVKRAVAKQQLQSEFPPPNFNFTPQFGSKVMIRSIMDKNNQPVQWAYSVIKLIHEYFSQFGELEQIEQNAEGERYMVFEKRQVAEDVLNFNGGTHTYNLMIFQLERARGGHDSEKGTSSIA